MPRLRPIRGVEPTIDDWASKLDDATRRERRAQWEDLSDSIHRYGAWVVSILGMRRMRIEAREGCDLAAKLESLGFQIDRCGVRMRLIGTEGRDGTIPVEILEIELPR